MVPGVRRNASEGLTSSARPTDKRKFYFSHVVFTRLFDVKHKHIQNIACFTHAHTGPTRTGEKCLYMPDARILRAFTTKML